MTAALHRDLKRLEALAFDRAEWAEPCLRRYHAAARSWTRAHSTTADALRLDVCPAHALAVQHPGRAGGLPDGSGKGKTPERPAPADH